MLTQNFILNPAQSDVIFKGARTASAFQKASTRIDLPGTGTVMHAIDSGNAAWVSEGARKPVGDNSSASKEVLAYKLVKSLVLSQELKDDAARIAAAVLEQLPAKFGRTFDQTAAGVVGRPGEKFDQLGGVNGLVTKTVTVDSYRTLIDAIAAVETPATPGGEPGSPASAIVLSTGMVWHLRSLTNSAGNPLLDLSNGTVMGLPFFSFEAPGAFGFVGAFDRSVYGQVGEVEIKVSTEGTFIKENGDIISLFQENKIGVIAEVRLGFRIVTGTDFVRIEAPSAPVVPETPVVPED